MPMVSSTMEGKTMPRGKRYPHPDSLSGLHKAILRRSRGASVRETAEIYGCSSATVSHLRRSPAGRELLRQWDWELRHRSAAPSWKTSSRNLWVWRNAPSRRRCASKVDSQPVRYERPSFLSRDFWPPCATAGSESGADSGEGGGGHRALVRRG